MKIIKNILKGILCVVLSLIVLWVIVGCVLIFYVAPRTDVKKIAQEIINENIDAKSSMSSLDFTFFSSFPYFALTIDDFAIYEKESNDTIAYVDKANFVISTTELLNGRIAIKDILIKNPYVNFVVDSTGNNNFSHILKGSNVQQDSSSVGSDKSLGIFNFNNMSIEKGKLAYSNATTDKSAILKDLNFEFQGRINFIDSVLDIRHGQFFIGDNNLDFSGHIDLGCVDMKISHNLSQFDNIIAMMNKFLPVDFFEDAEFNAVSDGECHISGELNDSLQGITISGRIGAEQIQAKSSNHKILVNDGNFELAYRFISGENDSTLFVLDHLNLEGKNLSLQLDGSMKNTFIDAHLKTAVNLTQFIKSTSLLPKHHTLEGNLKTDFTVHSSIDDLLHKYRFPASLKDLYDLNIAVVLPNVHGTMNLDDVKVLNDTIKIDADKLNITADGNKSRLITDFRNLKYTHNGKVENALINVDYANVNVSGKNLDAIVKIQGVNLTNVVNNKDSVFVSAEAIDLNLACKGNNIADIALNNLSCRSGENCLFSKRIDGHLMNLSKKPNKIWDACSMEMSSTNAGDDKLKLYCQKLSGSFNYDGNISDVKVNADSIDIQTEEYGLNVKQSEITTEGNDTYKLVTKSAASTKKIFGMDVSIQSLEAKYHVPSDLISLNAGRVTAGNTDISASGTIDITEKSPVVDVKLGGKFLDLNEIMIACNKVAHATGDPNAVPLDSIPEGQIPVTVGAVDQDITLALDMDKMTMSSLLLSNAKGIIYMKGRTTFIDGLNAIDNGYKLSMSTMVSYVKRRLSINDIILRFEKLDLSALGQIIPSIDDAIPLLSTLKGSVDLDIILSTPVRQILDISMTESKGAFSIQANNLSISDNQELKEVAKTLMFKDKENIKIDSLAVAAQLEHGQVKVLPVMATIDRYKLALAGENDLITKQYDYHISVLKSPIPFKFGIDLKSAGNKQKMKIVKTELKKLNPNVKPWTDPDFISFRNTLKQPFEKFKKTIQ